MEEEGRGSIQFDIGSPILELSPNILTPDQIKLSPEKSKITSDKSKMASDAASEFKGIDYPLSPIISKYNSQVTFQQKIMLYNYKVSESKFILVKMKKMLLTGKETKEI